MAHFSTQHVRDQASRWLDQVIRPAVHIAKAPVVVDAWEIPDEPIPFTQAVQGDFRPMDLDAPWGRPWGTTWLRVSGEIPSQWEQGPTQSAELIADIGFNAVQTGFQCEALAYDSRGRVIKAVEPFNRYVPLERVTEGGRFELYLEAASNPDVIHGWSFEPTRLGTPDALQGERQYRVREIAVGLRSTVVADLIIDLEVLLGLAQELGDDTTRGTQILSAVSRALQSLDPGDVVGTAATARAALEPVLRGPAHVGAHNISAVGHAHIDSAWLWPIRETARKVARTWSNVLDLMDQHPDFHFAASSAQQYAWLKEHHPDLFARLREAVRSGKFVPVGGMWVESDSNMPGGEAMARQFIEGTKLFRKEFGTEPAEAWLPDSFGYSASMPQIAKLAGAKWFLTQKLSWNEVNRMPHHTFWWEGLDGSRIFTHFPPSDTYGSDLGAADLHRAERQYSEKSVANSSLLLFGYGDGGGGPTREMLARAQRCAELAGSPKVKLDSPRNFFASAQEEYPDAPVWNGEMYLEFHRGVFTSQAEGKRGNRRTEALLHEAELWAATAAVRAGRRYPYEQLERLWRQTLLFQFHDILPGTCIKWVHDEVARTYAEMFAELETIIDESLTAIVGDGHSEMNAVAAPIEATQGGITAMTTDDQLVAARTEGDLVILEHAHARVVVNRLGRIVSAVDLATGREAIAEGAGGNVLQLFRDRPTTWDAWNIDRDYELVGRLLEADSVTLEGDVIVVVTSTGPSTITQRITLTPRRAGVAISTVVDWADQEQLLKLGFGLDAHADYSACETQFGHVKRPVHRNTSWDAARYEIPAHRWLHVGETDYGFALATSVYGHDVTRTVGEDGGTTTWVRASLLRGPRYPDPEADQGRHEFHHVLRLGATIADACDEGYLLHHRPRTLTGAHPVEPLATVTGRAVRLETVKLAEDGSGDLVLRLYESLGGRASTVLSVDPEFVSASITDLHETVLDPLEVEPGARSSIQLTLRPFQILTVRCARKA